MCAYCTVLYTQLGSRRQARDYIFPLPPFIFYMYTIRIYYFSVLLSFFWTILKFLPPLSLLLFLGKEGKIVYLFTDCCCFLVSPSRRGAVEHTTSLVCLKTEIRVSFDFLAPVPSVASRRSCISMKGKGMFRQVYSILQNETMSI